MKSNVTLTITSLLLIVLTMFHLASDIVHGMAPGHLSNLPVILVLAGWLYAALMLAERRSGLLVILIMSVLTSGLPVVHMLGSRGITAGLQSGGGFFFAWTLLALGTTAIVCVILSARGLWSLRRGQSRQGSG